MKKTNPVFIRLRYLAVPALILLLTGGLASCLKDSREDLSKSPPLVGFLFPSPGDYANNGGFTFSIPLAFSSTPQNLVFDSTQAYPFGTAFPLEVELSYTSFPNPYPKPVTVTLAIDSSIVAAINSANGTSYLAPPSGAVTLPNNGQVTIEPATLGNYPTARIVPTINTSLLDTTQTYILSLKIASAPAGVVVASNLNEGAIRIVVK